MCTHQRNEAIFSHFISLPGQLAIAKRGSDSYWSKADRGLRVGRRKMYFCMFAHSSLEPQYLAFNLRVTSI